MFYAFDISSLFDWKYLIVFITGIAFGFIFMMLVYLYSVIASLRKMKKNKKKAVDIDEIEIEMLIKDAQKQFKNKKKRKEIGLLPYFKQVNDELVKDIAKKYYPMSKYPLLELTVEETLELMNYISERINDFLSARILAPLKRRTLAQIRSIYDVKVKVEETKIVQMGKKVGAKRIGQAVLGVINVLNPAYWVKKVTVDRLYDIIIVKICLASIGIVGEESYKIYSKSVFRDPADLDIDTEELKDLIIDELGVIE